MDEMRSPSANKGPGHLHTDSKIIICLIQVDGFYITIMERSTTSRNITEVVRKKLVLDHIFTLNLHGLI